MFDAIYTIGHSTRPLEEFLALLKAHGIVQLADVRTIARSRRHPHFSMEALSKSLLQLGVTYRHFPSLGGLRKPRADSQNIAWRHEGFRGYADYMETPQFDSALDELLMFADFAPQTSVLDMSERHRGAPRVKVASRASEASGGGAPRAVMNGASAPGRGDEAPLRRSVLDTRERSACGSSERKDASEASGGGAPRAVMNGASASLRGGGAPRAVIMCAEAVWWRCHRQLIADALVARGIDVKHIGSRSAASLHTLTDFAHVDGGHVVYRRLI